MAEAPAPATAPKAAAAKKMQIVYYTWCPVGNCSKGGAHLGRSFSEKRARQRVYDHLSGSPWHQFERGPATEAADNVMVEQVEEEVDEEGRFEPPPTKRGPPEPVGPPPKRQALPATASSASSVTLVENAAAAVMTDLSAAIKQQTRNAYIFVKASKLFKLYVLVI
jgi:hypothetical protein